MNIPSPQNIKTASQSDVAPTSKTQIIPKNYYTINFPFDEHSPKTTNSQQHHHQSNTHPPHPKLKSIPTPLKSNSCTTSKTSLSVRPRNLCRSESSPQQGRPRLKPSHKHALNIGAAVIWWIWQSHTPAANLYSF